MIKKFVYLRDKENRPIVTICLLRDKANNMFGKGVSICSDMDYPIKKKGRSIAYERAFTALITQKSSLPILRKDVKNIIERCLEFEKFYSDDIMYKISTSMSVKELMILSPKKKTNTKTKKSLLKKILEKITKKNLR